MITEREFLHEIASPLAASICCIDLLLAEIKEGGEVGKDELILELQEAFASLAKLKELMAKRREELHRKDAV